jgi:hypothetical protein
VAEVCLRVLATGDTIANAAITKLSATGTVCIFASAETHVIADVTGYDPAA